MNDDYIKKLLTIIAVCLVTLVILFLVFLYVDDNKVSSVKIVKEGDGSYKLYEPSRSSGSTLSASGCQLTQGKCKRKRRLQ